MFYLELVCGVFFFVLGILMFKIPENYSKGNNEPKKIKNIKTRGIVTCVCGVLLVVLAFGMSYIDKQNKQKDQKISDLETQKEQLDDLRENTN